jgi:hypothetical protein
MVPNVIYKLHDFSAVRQVMCAYACWVCDWESGGAREEKNTMVCCKRGATSIACLMGVWSLFDVKNKHTQRHVLVKKGEARMAVRDESRQVKYVQWKQLNNNEMLWGVGACKAQASGTA